MPIQQTHSKPTLQADTLPACALCAQPLLAEHPSLPESLPTPAGDQVSYLVPEQTSVTGRVMEGICRHRHSASACGTAIGTVHWHCHHALLPRTNLCFLFHLYGQQKRTPPSPQQREPWSHARAHPLLTAISSSIQISKGLSTMPPTVKRCSAHMILGTAPWLLTK